MIRINQRSTGAIFLNKKTPPHIFTLVILAGVQALNMNLFLPSLPTMAEYFHVSYSVMQLSISGYFAATAFLPIIIGPISDRMGRRPVMISAISIFILAAICCEFSTTFGYFLFFLAKLFFYAISWTKHANLGAILHSYIQFPWDVMKK